MNCDRPEQILFDSNQEMLQRLENKATDAQKIIDIIASHYKGAKPTREQVIENHRQAIKSGYISD
ncbi:MAG: hypothetical protein RM338_06595 [Nostoc sp. DedQUE12a]|nr:hypothetical protein [Nostoc sp. DedQUE12a]